MATALSTRRNISRSRRGAIVVLVSILMIVFVILVAFSVDVSYMALIRSQQTAAVDAASKAGISTFVRTNGDYGAARTAAIEVAKKNLVANRPLLLSSDQIEFGRSDLQANQTWAFTKDGLPTNAVRIRSLMSETTAAGKVDLFFSKTFSDGTFRPYHVSIASNFDQELCLVLDRSHSMCFDESGVDWVYPAGIPAYPQSVSTPPHATNSRFAALRNAVSLFLIELNKAKRKPRVALVTWASEITEANFEFTLTGKTSKAVRLDEDLTLEYFRINDDLNAYAADVMVGGTNMAIGIDEGKKTLTSGNVRPLAQKTMVLMTDGMWNQGRDPYLAAMEAKAAGIQIYCISFLSTGDNSLLQQIAAESGGEFFLANNEAELVAAFQKLAVMLPISLTK